MPVLWVSLLLLCPILGEELGGGQNNTSMQLAPLPGSPQPVRDETHPLVTLLETAPHSLSLLIRPRNYHPDTMVRLLYERVSNSRQKRPIMQHLDDPVIVYIPLVRQAQSYSLQELPMGKYIVCGEAMLQAEVYQTSCFETIIQRLDTNKLQFGVRILIILSIVLVAAVIVYAVIYRVIKVRTLRKNKELSSTTNLMQEPPVRR